MKVTMRTVWDCLWNLLLLNSIPVCLGVPASERQDGRILLLRTEQSRSQSVESRAGRKDLVTVAGIGRPRPYLSPEFVTIRGGSSHRDKKILEKHDKSTTSPAEKLRESTSLSHFWSSGIMQVHQNYLHLFWQVVKATFIIMLPTTCLLMIGYYYLPSHVTPIIHLLEVGLLQLQTWINQVILFPFLLYTRIVKVSILFNDYNQVLRGVGFPTWLAVLIRPILDGIFLRWTVKTLWDKVSKFDANRAQENGLPVSHALRWTIFSSILYAIAHSGGSLPPPNWDQLQLEVANALDTGFVRFGSMSLYREHWNTAVVETLLRTQPLLITLGNGVVSGVLSWGLLCPLHQIHGWLASIGAQLAWAIIGWAHLDTQLAVRVLGRIFTPWSNPKGSSPSSRATLVMRPLLDTMFFRWGIRLLRGWWVQVYGYPQEWKLQTWLFWISVLFTISYVRTCSHLWPRQSSRHSSSPTIPFLKIATSASIHSVISFRLWSLLPENKTRLLGWDRVPIMCRSLRLVLVDLPGTIQCVRGLWFYSLDSMREDSAPTTDDGVTQNRTSGTTHGPSKSGVR